MNVVVLVILLFLIFCDKFYLFFLPRVVHMYRVKDFFGRFQKTNERIEFARFRSIPAQSDNLSVIYIYISIKKIFEKQELVNSKWNLQQKLNKSKILNTTAFILQVLFRKCKFHIAYRRVQHFKMTILWRCGRELRYALA